MLYWLTGGNSNQPGGAEPVGCLKIIGLTLLAVLLGAILGVGLFILIPEMIEKAIHGSEVLTH